MTISKDKKPFTQREIERHRQLEELEELERDLERDLEMVIMDLRQDEIILHRIEEERRRNARRNRQCNIL